MPLSRFTITSRCVADSSTIAAHIASAVARGLPLVPQYEPHDSVAVMVGSGPSLESQKDLLREMVQREHHYCVGLKDAADWLIEDACITPDYAVAIDPQASRARCFRHRRPSIHYLIASQCHPDMFDYLADYDVRLWHVYTGKPIEGVPSGTPMIGGGTTTGVRAITLLYTMGFRRFELFGYDSCLQNGVLRVNGDRPREGDDTVHEIVVNNKLFFCNPTMTEQAAHFQDLFVSMPDIQIRSHGGGLITEILKVRDSRPLRTVSFLNHYGPLAASYRYRTAIPAGEIGASINDLSADVLVIGKPGAVTIPEVKQALGRGQSVIADFCDNHFDREHERDLLRLADAITCPTEAMREQIALLGRDATVIPDPYEFEERPPHCDGDRLLWFGHPSNLDSLPKIAPLGIDYALTLVTTRSAVVTPPPYIRVVDWSRDTLGHELAQADIVLMPSTAATKSANRTIEAIRQGCFVVAEPHPSLTNIPGIWLGDLTEGVAWAVSHQAEANERIRASQIYVSRTYSPKIVAVAWNRAIQVCPSTWGQDVAPGRIGSMLTDKGETVPATSAASPLTMAAQTA